MDDTEQLLGSLSLDPEGIARQFMSLAALFNIVLAGLMGFLVLLVYLASSHKDDRDRNLFTVIPVLAILMAVMMRIEGPQMVVFFGIFGILSIIRFRSDLTDQKGITFILFAVIEGVLTGINAYLLALLAWLVVGGAILLSRRLFQERFIFRLLVKTPKVDNDARREVELWLKARNLNYRFAGCSTSSEQNAKIGAWDDRLKLEFFVFPDGDMAFYDLLPELTEQLKAWGMELELKRVD